MFAVPGWSVSAANLRTETATDSKATDKPAVAAVPKKRNRQSGPARDVNSGNVADLWERVIEGKSKKKQKVTSDSASSSQPKKRKKDRKRHVPEENIAPTADDVAAEDDLGKSGKQGLKGDSTTEPALAEKKEKRKKKSKKHQNDDGEETNHPSENIKQTTSSSAQAVPAAPLPKLTPLQASMREKLVSARFRHLNETLYTKPSEEAFELFEQSPEMFQEYHEGFRRQVNVWPENPIDGYIEDIKARGRQRQPPRDKGRPAHHAPSSSGPAPLLRTGGTCTIADLGCGDAKLAESLQSEAKKLKLNILSYDLQSPSPLVARADIANLPLEDGSVNIAIFCLALMGTNWLAFVEEAYRILHWKGELWVAEIKSRFAAPGANKSKKGNPVTHSVGNRKKNNKAAGSGKKKTAGDQEAEESELAVVVDGADDKRQETDVSAFVEALRKRGFVLHQGDGTAAVDLSNKMFVKMRFVKAAPATVGKNVVAGREPARGGPKKGAVKFIESADQGQADEASILKPCVYKIR